MFKNTSKVKNICTRWSIYQLVINLLIVDIFMTNIKILQIIFLEIKLNYSFLHRLFFPLLPLWLVNLNLRPSLNLNLGMDSTIPLSIEDIQVILTTIINLLTLPPTTMPWLPVLFNPTMAISFNHTDTSNVKLKLILRPTARLMLNLGTMDMVIPQLSNKDIQVILSITNIKLLTPWPSIMLNSFKNHTMVISWDHTITTGMYIPFHILRFISIYGNENLISNADIMQTQVVLSILWNVKLKPTVKLMLRPTLNLGTMEYTAIPINIKDSTMDMLMVKDTICLPTLDILPPTPDILLLLTPDILPLLTPDILPLFSHMPFKDQIPGPTFSRLKLLCNVCWSSLLKIMKFLNISTFHLANICIIKIRIKTPVFFGQ